MQHYKAILLTAISLLLVAWAVTGYLGWRETQQPFDYGRPTPLSDDEPMRTAVCAIRHELDQLPLPIVQQYIFHEAWTEYKIAAGRFEYGPVHQIVLTEQASDFVLSHSRTELIAALAPLLLSVETGGRAAAILAGLPVRSKSALSRTSPLAEAVQDARSNDPVEGVNWVPPQMGRFYVSTVPTSLYGLGNMGNRLERSVPRNHQGSFEARLEQVFQARAALPQSVLVLSDEPKTGVRLTIEEMQAQLEAPEPDTRYLDYLAAYEREDLLIALFPVLGQGRSAALIDMIWSSELADDLWPLTVGNPLIDGDPYLPVHKAFAEELIDMCST